MNKSWDVHLYFTHMTCGDMRALDEGEPIGDA